MCIIYYHGELDVESEHEWCPSIRFRQFSFWILMHRAANSRGIPWLREERDEAFREIIKEFHRVREVCYSLEGVRQWTALVDWFRGANIDDLKRKPRMRWPRRRPPPPLWPSMP
jgi:hypothetical protein